MYVCEQGGESADVCEGGGVWGVGKCGRVGGGEVGSEGGGGGRGISGSANVYSSFPRGLWGLCGCVWVRVHD